ncbi:MAG: phosphoribosylglycinamide formyltransferase [Ignavibacteriales bacterium]|nr:phosphoribosylglycinamide formyltransferase [Ignavibacteriales bacterium]
MFKISVFVSGRGSNLNAILKEEKKDPKIFKIVSVVTDRTDCKAIDTAKLNNLEIYFVSSKDKENFITYYELSKIFLEQNIDLIVLAGFLKKIPDEFVESFDKKIINIHPALLPLFGGKGMYGMNVHSAVFDSGMKVSGATIHFVDKVYDNGKIIFQKATDISNTKNSEEIADAVLKVEHEILPFVVRKFAEQKIKIIENRIYIK